MGMKISEATEYTGSNKYLLKIPVASDDGKPYFINSYEFAFDANMPRDPNRRINIENLLDAKNNTSIYSVKQTISVDVFNRINKAFSSHLPLCICTESYYGGAVYANACGYSTNGIGNKLQVSFVLNRPAHDDIDAWCHAYSLDILSPEEDATTCKVETIYDIDLLKVQESSEDNVVFVIEDAILEEGLTLTDEQDAKIRKAKLVYYKEFNNYYQLSYTSEQNDGYMEFRNTMYSMQNVSSETIEYWYNDSSYSKKLFIRNNTDAIVTQMSSVRLKLSTLFNITTQTTPDSLSSRNYNYINYSDANRVPLLLDTAEDSSYGCITANVYRKSQYDTSIYVTFICNIPNETTSEQHLITIKVQNTPTNDVYHIELAENTNLSKSSGIVELPNGALADDTITDDNLNILKQADGKIIHYSNYFYQCSVFGNDILLNGLTSGFNMDSTPVLFSGSYLISGEIKAIDNYTGIIGLKLNENGIYLDSTGDGTKFLADDGTYKTINTTEEIPVVNLQPLDGTTTYAAGTDISKEQYTISQEDFEKLSSLPEHIYFKSTGADGKLMLGTLTLKPNIDTQIVTGNTLFYTVYGAQITISYTTASNVVAEITNTLNLPVGDTNYFYNCAGNKVQLINIIMLDSSDTVILDQFDLTSPIIPMLSRTLASGKFVSYTLDSIAISDVADEHSYITTFRKIDYTTDQLNIVVIKISNSGTGELISDKTYTLTPKTE